MCIFLIQDGINEQDQEFLNTMQKLIGGKEHATELEPSLVIEEVQTQSGVVLNQDDSINSGENENESEQ